MSVGVSAWRDRYCVNNRSLWMPKDTYPGSNLTARRTYPARTQRGNDPLIARFDTLGQFFHKNKVWSFLSLSLMIRLLEFSWTACNSLSISNYRETTDTEWGVRPRSAGARESSRTLNAGLDSYVIWDEDEPMLVFRCNLGGAWERYGVREKKRKNARKACGNLLGKVNIKYTVVEILRYWGQVNSIIRIKYEGFLHSLIIIIVDAPAGI